MGLSIEQKTHQFLGKTFHSFKKFRYVMSLGQQRRSAQTFPCINYSLWKHLFCWAGISLIASILLSFSVFHWQGFLWGSAWFQSKYGGSLFCFFINKHCVSHRIGIYASVSVTTVLHRKDGRLLVPPASLQRGDFQAAGLHFSGDVQWSPALWAAQPVRVYRAGALENFGNI